MRHYKLTLVVWFWLIATAAFGQQANFWHQSLWWDGANVTMNGVDRMTNVSGLLHLTNNVQNTVGISFEPSAGLGGNSWQLTGTPGGISMTPAGGLFAVPGTISGTFSGNGASITALNATQLTSGTVPAGRLATNGSALTNLSLADGANGTWGSQAGMKLASGGPDVWSMGSPAMWGLAGDNAAEMQSGSTNVLDNSGWGVSITGYSPAGQVVLARTQGLTMSYISTNRTDGFINAAMEFVANYDGILARVWAFCSPGGGHVGASDSMNYAWLMWDAEHTTVGVPLTPTGFTNGGCNQPDSIVWDVTATPPTNAPTFYNDVYVDSAGKVLTAYSNNAAKTHLFFTSSSAGNPVAAGILTKISNLTNTASDATITYSAVSANRGWIGWGLAVDQKTGNTTLNSNITSLHGNFVARNASTNNNGLNIFSFGGNATPQGAAFVFGNSNNPQGMGEATSRGIVTMQLGTGTQPFMAAMNPNIPANNGWTPTAAVPSVAFGGLELGDTASFGSCDYEFHGGVGTMITNKAANYTLTIDDSTVVVKANGVAVMSIPDATGNNTVSHGKYRLYQLVNDGTTNFTIITTSNAAVSTNLETIGNSTTATNLTVVPGQALQLQSDGANWKTTYSPGVITTNFVSGQIYTNTYGRLIEVSMNAVLTTTGVAGDASLSLIASGYRTNYCSESTLLTSLASTNTNYVAMVIPPGQTYTASNTSAGAGDSASPLGGQILVY
jgi:hypothetical protein